MQRFCRGIARRQVEAQRRSAAEHVRTDTHCGGGRAKITSPAPASKQVRDGAVRGHRESEERQCQEEPDGRCSAQLTHACGEEPAPAGVLFERRRPLGEERLAVFPHGRAVLPNRMLPGTEGAEVYLLSILTGERLSPQSVAWVVLCPYSACISRAARCRLENPG